MAMERNLQNMSPNDLENRFEKMNGSMKGTPDPLPDIQRVAKIQMVANELRERTDLNSYYVPKVVSMGPIHHGKWELRRGEEHKLHMAQEYITNTGGNPEQLYKMVADKLGDLKRHFAENVLTLASETLGDFGSFDEKLTWMLFMDGCALLCILRLGYYAGEPEGTLMKLVIRDVFLLENQLPMSLLYLLSESRFGLENAIYKFLGYIHSDNRENRGRYSTSFDDKNMVKEIPYKHSAHLLHEFRTWLLPYSFLYKIDIW